MGTRIGFVVAALLAVAVAEGGCGGDSCSGTYNCPALVHGEVLVPATLPAAVSHVTADASCNAVSLAGDMTGPIAVSYGGSIPAGTTKTCDIRAQLSNGMELVASVSFEGVICCGNTAVGSPSTLKVVDGGVADSANAN
jgi:hypothetical protein